MERNGDKRRETAEDAAGTSCLRLAINVALNVLMFILVVLPVVLIYGTKTQPFKRGFFCSDESITYPYKPFDQDAVSPKMLLCTTLLVPVAIVLLVEVVVFIQQKRKQESPRRDDVIFCNSPNSRVAVTSLMYIGVYLFGFACTMSSTMAIKYYTGRLRPYFLAVCRPNTTLFNCTDPHGFPVYVDSSVCTGDAALLRQARMSHPSGHASAAMFAAVFITLYLQLRMSSTLCVLFRPVLQFTALMLGVTCCVSRVSDYKHHWSDVLAGGILGIFVAVVTIVTVSDLVFTSPVVRAWNIKWSRSLRRDPENPSDYTPIAGEEVTSAGRIGSVQSYD